MLSLLRDLVAHKAYANAAFLAAIETSDAASADPEVLDLLHHIHVSNRFWIRAVRRLPFVVEREAAVARELGALRGAFRATQEEEAVWLATATEGDCDAELTDPLIPGGGCLVREALTQVCLHSQGHRAQMAKMIRRHGVIPPPTDFILWKASSIRPAALPTD